jgi:hypothetical protein
MTKDWFMPKDGGRAYWVTRAGIIFFAMKSDGAMATTASVEIVEVVAAWYRGTLLPRRDAPTLAKMLDIEADPDHRVIDAPKPEPIEIAGGITGLQKHLVAMAKANRNLDPAAIKTLFDQHDVVIAVWDDPQQFASPAADGPGFLTMKGFDIMLDKVKHSRGKKIPVSMGALWCNNKEHAEMLCRTYGAP